MAHDAKEFPRTVAEAADKVLSELSEEDKKVVRETPGERLFELYFGLGTFVRNSCGLWAGNEDLIEACARGRHPGKDEPPYLYMHPDDASAVIVEEVWRKLQA